MAFGFEWLDARTSEIIMTVSSGTAVGTLWRMVTRPETNWKKFLIKATVSLTVGPVIGGAIVEYFDFHKFIAVSVGSICAFLAEEVLVFFQARGRKLEKGQIDISLSGKDEDEEEGT